MASKSGSSAFCLVGHKKKYFKPGNGMKKDNKDLEIVSWQK